MIDFPALFIPFYLVRAAVPICGVTFMPLWLYNCDCHHYMAVYHAAGWGAWQSEEICCSPGVAFPEGCGKRPTTCWVVESYQVGALAACLCCCVHSPLMRSTMMIDGTTLTHGWGHPCRHLLPTSICTWQMLDHGGAAACEGLTACRGRRA